jgi:hypothetical protein
MAAASSWHFYTFKKRAWGEAACFSWMKKARPQGTGFECMT